MEALDIAKEDPRIRERYGKGDPQNRDDGGPKLMEHFLMARRLVEAGTRCVTLAFSRWDHHGDNFGACRQDMPMLDQGLSALDRRSAQSRHGEGRVRRRVGRIWPHAQDQQGRRPRPLAERFLRAAGRRRNANRPESSVRPIGWAARPRTARCISRKCLPRSITAWAST